MVLQLSGGLIFVLVAVGLVLLAIVAVGAVGLGIYLRTKASEDTEAAILESEGSDTSEAGNG